MRKSYSYLISSRTQATVSCSHSYYLNTTVKLYFKYNSIIYIAIVQKLAVHIGDNYFLYVNKQAGIVPVIIFLCSFD
jgi:hypothetical protein